MFGKEGEKEKLSGYGNPPPAATTATAGELDRQPQHNDQEGDVGRLEVHTWLYYGPL
jgi:hypothetical protein